ncbi:MAG: hypothetical protein A2017_06875 [Lentisphaerae bacterium GWF2_44_16]|nr:MAG: hypothetical protein A2017_06875 [Lentisphaerae bacterium GWF2_44_16]
MSNYSDRKIISGTILALLLVIGLILIVAYFFPTGKNIFTGPYIEWMGPSKAVIMMLGKADRNLEFSLYAKGEKKPLRKIKSSGKVHTFRLDSLSPDTEYIYSIKGRGVNVSCQFRTAPSIEHKDFTFIVYGDSRSRRNTEIYSRLASYFKGHIPAFALHTGNILIGDTENSGDFFGFDWHENAFKPLPPGTLGSMPIFRTKGKHDVCSQDTEKAFSMAFPSLSKTVYSFMWGNVHFVCLNGVFNSLGDYTQEIRNALYDEIRKYPNARWRTAFFHVPPYSAVKSSSPAENHELNEKLLEDFSNLKIDIVFNGGEHLYARTKPLISEGNTLNPVQFITSGGGGAKLDDIEKRPYLAKIIKSHHFCVVDVTYNLLTVQAFNSNNSLIDKFKIRKDDAGKNSYAGSEIFSMRKKQKSIPENKLPERE